MLHRFITGKVSSPRTAYLPAQFFSSHIIAILAAILFPVFERAREKSYAATCISNVKQLALAILMYAQDNDQYAPLGNYDSYDQRWSAPGCALGGAAPNYIGWAEMTYPWVLNAQMYGCPADPARYGGRGSGDYNNRFRYCLANNTATTWQSYCMNDKKSPHNFNFSLISDAGGMIMLADAVSANNMDSEANISTWHFGGANSAYVDGHAKYIIPSAIPKAANCNTTAPISATQALSNDFWLGVD
jgi:prepilin-type processing-associated H-X9-DG protein